MHLFNVLLAASAILSHWMTFLVTFLPWGQLWAALPAQRWSHLSYFDLGASVPSGWHPSQNVVQGTSVMKFAMFQLRLWFSQELEWRAFSGALQGHFGQFCYVFRNSFRLIFFPSYQAVLLSSLLMFTQCVMERHPLLGSIVEKEDWVLLRMATSASTCLFMYI